METIDVIIGKYITDYLSPTFFEKYVYPRFNSQYKILHYRSTSLDFEKYKGNIQYIMDKDYNPDQIFMRRFKLDKKVVFIELRWRGDQYMYYANNVKKYLEHQVCKNEPILYMPDAIFKPQTYIFHKFMTKRPIIHLVCCGALRPEYTFLQSTDVMICGTYTKNKLCYDLKRLGRKISCFSTR